MFNAFKALVIVVTAGTLAGCPMEDEIVDGPPGMTAEGALPEQGPEDPPPGPDGEQPPPGAEGEEPPPGPDGRPPRGERPPPGGQPPAPEPAEPEPAEPEPAEPEPAEPEPAEPEPAEPGPQADNFAPSPADNPTTPEKVELGRLLFFDPILSGNQDVACATCHHPRHGYADGIALSIGVGGTGLGPNRRLGPGTAFIGRNSPTVLNTGLNGWTNADRLPNPNTAPMFWDNRDESLEAQALGPIRNGAEMRGDVIAEDEIVNVVVERLAGIPEYVALFNDAFGRGGVDELRLAQAISAFERHLSRPDTRFDRGELTAQEQRGLDALRATGCTDCHGGPMFSDYQLHRLGAPDNPDGNAPDLGDGQRRFRTPTLRNIALTGPYMHGGTFRTLQDVLNFYARQAGGAGGGRPGPGGAQGLDPQLLDLRINPRAFPDMIAFMQSLNDADIDRAEPPSVPSGLRVGGR